MATERKIDYFDNYFSQLLNYCGYYSDFTSGDKHNKEYGKTPFFRFRNFYNAAPKVAFLRQHIFSRWSAK
jgi:hypothetical protein